MYVCIYVCMYACMYVCITLYVYIYVCIFECMHLYLSNYSNLSESLCFIWIGCSSDFSENISKNALHKCPNLNRTRRKTFMSWPGIRTADIRRRDAPADRAATFLRCIINAKVNGWFRGLFIKAQDSELRL